MEGRGTWKGKGWLVGWWVMWCGVVWVNEERELDGRWSIVVEEGGENGVISCKKRALAAWCFHLNREKGASIALQRRSIVCK